ncbi:MAG TPA: hypothetical protein VM889_13340 [Candidatus Thermoplasmatota archaeon]|nr:hypothetical protein [Candidatus Thermoplasmatota archaeon]HWH08112.1 hypothetical protein [Candidatus Thermoplasmatota archaeon]
MPLRDYVDVRAVARNLTSPAYLGTMAILGVGLWAADRYAAPGSAWRNLRFVTLGALGAGVGYGILAPLFPPLSRGLTAAAATSAAAASAVAAASQPSASPPPPSRAQTNKQFEPAQGVESSGVFVGQ